MRTIMNISLPAELSDVVEKNVASGSFSSKSEFIRHLLRLWIQSEELEESRRELKQGNGKLLRSLKDLR